MERRLKVKTIVMVVLVIAAASVASWAQNFANMSSSQLFEKGLDYYQNGDFKNAYKYFFRLSDTLHRDNAKAQYMLGLMYFHGQGVEIDRKKAYYWFTQAAGPAAPQANRILGIYAENGIIGPIDLKLALEKYEEAARCNDSVAQQLLGSLYFSGRGTRQSYEEALKWYLRSAEQKNPEAAFNIGFMHMEGMGCQKNPQEGISWLKKASLWGDGKAEYYLGRYSFLGKGMKKDIIQARKHLERAIELGYEPALMDLAETWLIKDSGKTDGEKAIELFLKAAANGDAAGFFRAGMVYEYGVDVEINLEKAEELYERSVKAGYEEAEYHLGMMLIAGDLIAKDEARGLGMIKSAASKGHQKAKDYLNE